MAEGEIKMKCAKCGNDICSDKAIKLSEKNICINCAFSTENDYIKFKTELNAINEKRKAEIKQYNKRKAIKAIFVSIAIIIVISLIALLISFIFSGGAYITIASFPLLYIVYRLLYISERKNFIPLTENEYYEKQFNREKDFVQKENTLYDKSPNNNEIHIEQQNTKVIKSEIQEKPKKSNNKNSNNVPLIIALITVSIVAIICVISLCVVTTSNANSNLNYTETTITSSTTYSPDSSLFLSDEQREAAHKAAEKIDNDAREKRKNSQKPDLDVEWH